MLTIAPIEVGVEVVPNNGPGHEDMNTPKNTAGIPSPYRSLG